MKAQDVLNIGQLFDRLNWPTTDDHNGQFPHLFERFCKMCACLDPAERDLILNITQDYQWILRRQEDALLLSAWNTMLSLLTANTNQVSVIPLLKPGSSRPKSSDEIYRLARRYQANLVDRTAPRRLSFFKNGADFARGESEPGSAIVLLDDYVGTGDTTKKAIMKLRAKYPLIAQCQIFVLVLVAQRDAFAEITQFAQIEHINCSLIAGQTLFRGITNGTHVTNVPHALAMMLRIGSKLKIKTADRLGYGSTEALVTLARTPNNTFPIYWTNKKVKGEVWNSPFTRYTERGS